MNDIVKIQEEVNTQIENKEVMDALITTTFKKFSPQLVKRAIMEGMMRGFTFKDFLEKNVYAIKFGDEYTLITSIDYARKVGMRSGIVGKDAPVYDEKDNKIVSCTVTVKKHTISFDGKPYIGDFTATVYFNEYTTNRNQWASKPHTMIAKVAEMHALRMACPEEMAQMYVEEEQQQEAVVVFDNSEYEKKLKGATTLDELKRAWDSLPAPARTKEVIALKDQLKSALQSPTIDVKEQIDTDEPPVDFEAAEANLVKHGTIEPPTEEEQKAQEEFIEKEGIESIPF
jgi:hypothetical protein